LIRTAATECGSIVHMRSWMLGTAGIVAVVAGCADPSRPEQVSIVARTDLTAALGSANVHPVGVAVAPSGERFVFDETMGLYRIESGTATAVVPMSSLPAPDMPIQLPITDITAIAPGLFALTAIGDGFLLDTNAMTLKQHFCYVPEGTPVDYRQHTDAIAYDAAHGHLFAQPVTFDTNNVFQVSQLAAYDADTGLGVQWNTVANDVAATGMAMVPGVGLLFGQGAQLSVVDPATGFSTPYDSLARFDIHSIDGIAVDSTTDTVVIVDGVTSELVELELAPR
jgi:hypothetical protein